MIIFEVTTINGKKYDKHYSDLGMMIERNNCQYSEAIDVLDSNLEYIETDIPIHTKESEIIE